MKYVTRVCVEWPRTGVIQRGVGYRVCFGQRLNRLLHNPSHLFQENSTKNDDDDEPDGRTSTMNDLEELGWIRMGVEVNSCFSLEKTDFASVDKMKGMCGGEVS